MSRQVTGARVVDREDEPGLAASAVLVVEDNDTTRRRMVTLLRNHGYEVAEALDGIDALQQVGRRAFSAILLDLVLPNVDGWQFRASQLAQPELASIPTVIVTSRPLRVPDHFALRPAGVVPKPFEDTELLTAVGRACRTPAPRQPAVVPDDQLFWSRRGETACGNHAPTLGTPAWITAGWMPIPAHAGKGRVRYRCQHCSAGPIEHRVRTREER